MIGLKAKIYLIDYSVGTTSNFVVDRKNLLSLSSTSIGRDDKSKPSFGIVSNSSKVEFKDTDGTLYKYAHKGVLTKNLKVETFVYDTLTKHEQLVSTMFTDNWDYNSDTSSFTVQTTDGLTDWQEIIFPRLSIDPRKNNTTNMVYIYGLLAEFANANSRVKVADFANLDGKTQRVLQETNLLYPILHEGSLWEQFTKLCVACRLHIYANEKGEAMPHYEYGE